MIFKAIIIETREIENLYEIIAHKHLNFLPLKYDLEIFLGEKNSHLLENKKFDRCTKIKILKENINSLNDYNNLLTKKEFWKNLSCDKVLIFQSDSGLLKKGIERFEKYDWVGAPWPNKGWSKGKSWKKGANGGLSLRSVNKMIEVIEKYPYDGKINEDGYFSVNLQKIKSKMAPRRINKKFAVESLFKLGTIGYHAIEKHFSPEKVNQIMNQYVK